MLKWMTLTLAAVVAAMTFSVSSAPANDDYWGGYWNWYDGNYVPYYSRTYSYRPSYNYGSSGYGYNQPYYGGSGYGYNQPYYGGSGYGYNQPYYGGYGYGQRSGGSVQIGPLRFGWR